MTTPLFVIHGIGNRDKASYEAMVAALAREIGDTAATPVYWGDLGAQYDLIAHTVPTSLRSNEVRDIDPPLQAEVEMLANFLLADPAPFEAETRASGTVPAIVLEAANVQRVGDATSAEVRGGATDDPTAADVRFALERNWSDTQWLSLTSDVELLRAVGLAIGDALVDAPHSSESDTEVRGPEMRGFDTDGFIRRRLLDLDRVVGATIGMAAGRLNADLRTKLLPGVSRAVGDILVYQRNQEKVHERVRDVIASVDAKLGSSNQYPVNVLAHSLGGVIAVDMATSDHPLWIRNLVTFGSQPAYFHVCDPRGGSLSRYAGSPVDLPPSIGAWTNLWEPLDPLAFTAAKVFRLFDKTSPRDIKVPHLASSGLWTHSVYWALDFVVDSIRQAVSIASD